MAKFSAPKNDEITLTFNFDFHQKRADDTKNKRLIQDTLAELGFSGIEINTQIDKKQSKNYKKSPKTNIGAEPKEIDQEISSVQNIFGSVQVLE